MGMRKSLVVISLLMAIVIFSIGCGLIINLAYGINQVGGIVSGVVSFYLTTKLFKLLEERNNAKN
jgi:hypothetical protein